MNYVTDAFFFLWNYTHPGWWSLLLTVTLVIVGFTIGILKNEDLGGEIVLMGFWAGMITTIILYIFANNVDQKSEFAINTKNNNSLQLAGTYLDFGQAIYFSKEKISWCKEEAKKDMLGNIIQKSSGCVKAWISDPKLFQSKIQKLSFVGAINYEGSGNTKQLVEHYLNLTKTGEKLPDFISTEPVKD